MENQTPTENSNKYTSTIQSPTTYQTTTHLILPILFTALLCAIVFGVGGYHVGKQSKEVSTKQYQSDAFPSPSVLPTTIIESPTQSATPTVEGTEQQIGYINSVYTKEGQSYLTIDYIQWLDHTNGGCNTYSEKRSDIPECNPNGYLVINSNPQIRTLKIDKSVVIDYSESVFQVDGQPLTAEYMTLEEFQEIYSGNDNSFYNSLLRDSTYRIELSNNVVTRIKFQYRP
jgi:hypothetical protein